MRAHQPSIPENQLYQSELDKIHKSNKALPPEKYRNKKKALSAEWFFKYQKIKVDQQKGGLDAVFYTFRIYEDLLFPYYKQIVRL